MPVQRWRSDAKQTQPSSDQTRSKSRADVLASTAEMTRRGADAYLELEQTRGRIIARSAAGFGLLGPVLAGAVAGGIGNAHVIGVLAGLASLVPTAFALWRSGEGDQRLASAGTDRGFCQAVAVQARHLGERLDAPTLVQSPDDVINDQLDLLYKTFERSRQRLAAAGAAVGPGSSHRVSERIVPDQSDTVIVTAEKRRYPVRIVDLSMASVTLRGSLPPLAPNDQIQVGARKARLTSATATRATFQFLTPIVLSEFNGKIVL